MRKLIKKIAAGISSLVLMTTMLTVPVTNAASKKDVSNLSAMEICADMGVGWNLGNSLDAYASYGMSSETSWGNPKTTKAMIDTVKAKGFNTVRVPTTWFNHMDGNNNVDAEWMARVKEVVNYCVDNDMYVILNSHHDHWNRPTEANYDAASAKLKVLWKQIATEFKDYDRYLIFEGMNEPRNYDGANEWDGGTSEMHKVINKLNADFVSTVRATGGNNANRCLMIPTYAASAEYAAMAALDIPDDDNIIVSIHSYSPFKFAFDSPGTDKFTDDMAAELDSIFQNYSNLFVSNGIPVCLGEFSATNKNNLDERVKWAAYYAKKSKELGISCVIWDNNSYYSGGSEAHGHLDRNNLTWYDSAVIDSLINSYKNAETNIPEPIKIPDITDANSTILSSTPMSSSGYSPTSGVLFDFTTMQPDSFIAVEYTSESVPVLVVQDNRAWKVWATISPIAVKNSIAYFSYDDIVKTYTAHYKGAYGEEPATTLANAFQLFMTGNGVDISVGKIYYVESDNSNPEPAKDISTCAVTLSQTSYVYDGNSKTPTVTVKDGSTTLAIGVDYVVSYANNRNIGTATVNVYGEGKYTGSKSVNFSIVADESLSAVEFKDGYTSTEDAIRINWNAVTNAEGYIVYRLNNSTGNYDRIGKTSELTFRDSGLKAGTTYKYKVEAYKTVGNTVVRSPMTNVKTAATKSSDTLSAVTFKDGYTSTTDAIRINWNKVDGAEGYIVYRLNNSTGNYDRVAKTSELTYRDSGLKSGTTYQYKVEAYKTVGNTVVRSPMTNVKFASTK